MKVSKEDKDTAIKNLREILAKDDRVYGIIRSVARSGLSRTIDFYVIKNNQPVYLSGYMSKVLGLAQDKRGALKVAGGGMDMVFATVYDLSRALFDNGFTIKHDSL